MSPTDRTLTDTDWEVILKQGRYWREDAGLYMTDIEYKEWMRGEVNAGLVRGNHSNMAIILWNSMSSCCNFLYLPEG